MPPKRTRTTNTPSQKTQLTQHIVHDLDDDDPDVLDDDFFANAAVLAQVDRYFAEASAAQNTTATTTTTTSAAKRNARIELALYVPPPHLDVDASNDDALHRSLTDISAAIEPRITEDLCVHPRKLKELRDWIHATCVKGDGLPRILVVTGPPGAAKSVSLRVLCAEAGVEVLEWRQPADVGRDANLDSIVSNDRLLDALDARLLADQLAPKGSTHTPTTPFTRATVTSGGQTDDVWSPGVVASFKEFLLRASKVPSLTFNIGIAGKTHTTVADNMLKIVLVDDLPNITHFDTRKAVHDTIRQYMGRCQYLESHNSVSSRISHKNRVYPLVFVMTEILNSNATESYLDSFDRDDFSLSTLIPNDILYRFSLGEDRQKTQSSTSNSIFNPYVARIAFNPVAKTYLTKAIKRISSIISDIADTPYTSEKFNSPLRKYCTTLTPGYILGKHFMDMAISISQGDLRYLTTMCTNRAFWTRLFIRKLISGMNTASGTKKRKQENKITPRSHSIEDDFGDDIDYNDGEDIPDFAGMDPRDNGLGQFNLLGKILYCKRLAPSGTYIENAQSFLNNPDPVMDIERSGVDNFLRFKLRLAQTYPSKENVEELLYKSRMNLENLLEGCFENYIPFAARSQGISLDTSVKSEDGTSSASNWWSSTGMETVARLSEAFSTADYINDPWRDLGSDATVSSTAITGRYLISNVMFYLASMSSIEFPSSTKTSTVSSDYNSARGIARSSLPKVFRSRKLEMLSLKDAEAAATLFAQSSGLFDDTNPDSAALSCKKRGLANFITTTRPKLRVDEISYRDMIGHARQATHKNDSPRRFPFLGPDEPPMVRSAENTLTSINRARLVESVVGDLTSHTKTKIELLAEAGPLVLPEDDIMLSDDSSSLSDDNL